jgi:fermentation-respiration switch protein FrsA (DUF1100 family)
VILDVRRPSVYTFIPMADGRVLGVLGALALLASAAVALLWVMQRRLIYFPLVQDLPPVRTSLPDAEEVTFQTADGVRLGGWFLAAGGAPGPAVLIFNGNAGDRSYRAPLAAALTQQGWSVLLFDYRGYAGNPGSPSETGLVADARAARAYLAGRAEVDAARITYFGESLGAAVAVALAVETPPAALVLRSPFTSLADMGRLHYPGLPFVDVLLRDRFASIDRIAQVRCPVLVIAGGRDTTVPAEQSRRLYAAAPEPKRFVLIPGADHNDFDLLAGQVMIDEVSRFLGSAPSDRRQ